MEYHPPSIVSEICGSLLHDRLCTFDVHIEALVSGLVMIANDETEEPSRSQNVCRTRFSRSSFENWASLNLRKHGRSCCSSLHPRLIACT